MLFLWCNYCLIVSLSSLLDVVLTSFSSFLLFFFSFVFCPVLGFFWFSLGFSRSLCFDFVFVFVNMCVSFDFSFDFHFYFGFVFDFPRVLVVYICGFTVV